MYKEMEHNVVVLGTGETKEGALANAMGQIKNNVSSELKGMIFRIEPMDMKILSASHSSYRERFLGLFFPRTRSRYQIELSIKVRVVLIEVDKIAFESNSETKSAIKQFLHQQ